MSEHLPELLTSEQMQQVDRRVADSGQDTYTVMQSAGIAVANHVLDIAPRAPTITVLAGSGHNAGDGYIAATELHKYGCDVVVIRTERELKSDSDVARAASHWRGPNLEVQSGCESLPEDVYSRMRRSDIIVDALLGAGLSRAVSGDYRLMIESCNKLRETTDIHVVAVDLPSGLDGDHLIARDLSIYADSTVTFFRFKLIHVLSLGRQRSGDIKLAQIGISQRHLDNNENYTRLNSPLEFSEHLPTLTIDTHKFARGAVLVRGGPIDCTGAARLTANAALGCGAGLVTMTTPHDALSANTAQLTAVMLTECESTSDWANLLKDQRWRVAVIGPGNGPDQSTRDAVIAALESSLSCVLDADALSCWQGHTEQLQEILVSASTTPVLTPHAGEFERLFGVKVSDTEQGATKFARTKAAAQLTESVIVFKGPDTVIASPDGRICINNNAPPWLATAGAGDVLAGIIGALIAQGMPSFEAAIAAVWIHGEAASKLRCPMTAEELGPVASDVLANLLT